MAADGTDELEARILQVDQGRNVKAVNFDSDDPVGPVRVGLVSGGEGTGASSAHDEIAVHVVAHEVHDALHRQHAGHAAGEHREPVMEHVGSMT